MALFDLPIRVAAIDPEQQQPFLLVGCRGTIQVGPKLCSICTNPLQLGLPDLKSNGALYLSGGSRFYRGGSGGDTPTSGGVCSRPLPLHPCPGQFICLGIRRFFVEYFIASNVNLFSLPSLPPSPRCRRDLLGKKPCRVTVTLDRSRSTRGHNVTCGATTLLPYV